MKIFKPTSPASRHRIILKSNPNKPFKPLIKGLYNTGFRNNLGRITIRHRGAGHKKCFRFLDFNRNFANHSPFQIVRIEKDPNRTGLIALCKTIKKLNDNLNLKKYNNSVWINGYKYFYILAPHNVSEGSIIKPDLITHGSTLPLKKIQLGTLIYNIEFNGKS